MPAAVDDRSMARPGAVSLIATSAMSTSIPARVARRDRPGGCSGIGGAADHEASAGRQMLGGLNRPPSLTRPTPRRPEPCQDTARRISTAAWSGVPTRRPGLVLPCGGKLTKRWSHTSTGCRRDRSDQLGVDASPHLRSRTTKPCARICISNPFARHRLIG
jgi:hypothetical protein